MSLRAALAVGSLLACTAPFVAAQGREVARTVEHVVDFSLADAAIAVADPYRPVIYYNPAILGRAGLEMTRFILAHEDAHIELAHLRVADGVVDAARLRGLELDADCLAARWLSVDQPAAVAAAAAYFLRQGATRTDEFHPSGVERADRIVACGAAQATRGLSATTGPGEASRPRPVRVDGFGPPDVR